MTNLQRASLRIEILKLLTEKRYTKALKYPDEITHSLTEAIKVIEEFIFESEKPEMVFEKFEIFKATVSNFPLENIISLEVFTYTMMIYDSIFDVDPEDSLLNKGFSEQLINKITLNNYGYVRNSEQWQEFHQNVEACMRGHSN